MAEPTVVVVEDLHWADRESRLALLTAAQRLDRDAVVMVVTSRPEAGAMTGGIASALITLGVAGWCWEVWNPRTWRRWAVRRACR